MQGFGSSTRSCPLARCGSFVAPTWPIFSPLIGKYCLPVFERCGALGDKRPNFFLMHVGNPTYSFAVGAVRVCIWHQIPAPLVPCKTIAPVPILYRIRCGDAWG